MEAQQVAEAGGTTPISTVIEGYVAMWNELDAARRRAAIEATWTREAHYVDPHFTADGVDGLDALMIRVREQFPGYCLRLSGAVDAHHDRARWSWAMVGPEGATAILGTDFAVLAPDGRLREVTGFIQQPGTAAEPADMTS